MDEHPDDLGEFLTTDIRGKALPGYLDKLSVALAVERETIDAELRRLTNGVSVIREIVSAQQSLAGVHSVIESVGVRVSDLVEDALRIAGLSDGTVTVIRDFGADPPLLLDKHRVLMVLLNLLSNATRAMEGNQADDRLLTITSTVNVGQDLTLTVADNGAGIEPKNLTRIFEHGFTTHADGHGFGLHSSALAAEQMRGSLSVTSDRVAGGAVFTLHLPLKREQVTV